MNPHLYSCPAYRNLAAVCHCGATKRNEVLSIVHDFEAQADILLQEIYTFLEDK